MENLKDVIPSSVNDEVAVFRGCTTSELIVLICGSAAVWLPVTSIVGLAMGNFFMVAGLSMVLVLVTVIVLATMMQNIKQGKPEGYYQHKIRLLFGRKNLIKQPFFVHDGVLSTERSDCLVFLRRDLKIDEEDI